MNILLVVFTFNYLKYLGRSLKNIFTKNLQITSISDIKIDYFYPLLSIFFIGNCALFLNFFLPLKNLGVIFFIFGFFLIIYDFFKNNLPTFSGRVFLEDILTPSILAISTYGVWLGWDTGLYHLPHQLMLREQVIVFGATNLNLWFGWSGILEYVASLFWLENNWIFIRIFEIVFFATFFNIVLSFLTSNKNQYYKLSGMSIIIFGLLDNYGYKGGGNGFFQFLTVGKYDSAVGLLFFIVTVLIVNELIEKSFKIQDFYMILLLSLFTVQIKQTGAYLIFLLIPYLILFLKSNDLKFLEIFKKIKIHLLILLLWLSKNVIISSCLFFPIEQTCFPFLAWHETVQLDFIVDTMRSLPITFSSELSIYEQAVNWFNWSKNDQFIINFPITLFIIITFFIVSLTNKNTKIIPDSLTNFYFVIFIILNFVTWFISNYGNIRYGYGLWAILTSYVAFLFKDRKFKFDLNKLNIIVIILYIFTIIQLPRGYSYAAMIDSKLAFTPIEITKDKGMYPDSDSGFGVYPTENILCWDVKNCKMKDKKVDPFKYLHTTIYYPDGVSGD